MNHSKIVIAATVLFSLLAASQAHADIIPHLEWVRTYDSPETFYDYDSAGGVVVDTAGDIYVVGSVERRDIGQYDNIWLRKYDAYGNVIWTKEYDSPSHAHDSGASITLDTAGNIFCCGYVSRDDLGEGFNIWAGKFDAVGGLIWTTEHNGFSNGLDWGRDITLDDDGNVYVVGHENRSDLGESSNLWLGKYDGDGNILWTQTYDSPAHEQDEGRAVAVDSSGNVYVAGYEDRSDLGQKYNTFVRKYDANGNTLWTQTYDSSAHGADVAWGIVTDDLDNIYVVGTECQVCTSSGQLNDIWIRKYDAEGNTLWTQTYDGPAHGTDYAFNVTLDAAGNLYVTGNVDGDSGGLGAELWVARYDSNGNIIWTETYDSPSQEGATGSDVAVDALGNVYVAGWEYRYDLGQYQNIILLKYAQIPEPSTLLLLAPALLGFAGLARRKCRSVGV